MKKVGKVTLEERNQIQALFERKSGLGELAQILTPEKAELYDKLVKDLGTTSVAFQKWWDEMSKKYSWERSPNGHWEINFDTCEIFLGE